MGSFARVQFEKKMVIEDDIGTLIYPNLHSDKDLDIRYGKRVMSEIVKEVQTIAVQIRNAVKDTDGRSHAWGVSE